MKKPTWTPEPKDYSFCEVEDIIQDDEQIASFRYNSNLPDKGWVFQGYKDKYGFWIWSEEDNNRMWDDKITIAQKLINSKIEKFILNEDEEIYAYKYGGFLSIRGGYFIVNKKEPNKILRSIMTIIS